MIFRMEGLLNHIVSSQKGRLSPFEVEGKVSMRIGWWLDKVLGRWKTFVASNRSCQSGLHRALSRRFMTSLESLLLV